MYTLGISTPLTLSYPSASHQHFHDRKSVLAGIEINSSQISEATLLHW
ncbi:hypothetical protein OIU74_017386 [Salix koriyanagi]|uniref:Uncharacterized protein n=1 Tax=Salix koriyanagi TaxID=2511006 RepID=A0A9Q1AH23_9ROSI|nr:hypothetical protein OIU74_017386 [Salix koriyanagi]